MFNVIWMINYLCFRIVFIVEAKDLCVNALSNIKESMIQSEQESEKIKKGDVQTFEILFKRYYEPLVYYAYRYLNDKNKAEDIVHDLFINLWKNRKKITFEEHIKTYLFNAARNLSLNDLKKSNLEKKYKIQNVFIEYDPDTPETVYFNQELLNSIEKAIASLPDKRREIFCMHRFESLTYHEIASILDLSVKTVEKQMTRALKHLRKHLDQYFMHPLI